MARLVYSEKVLSAVFFVIGNDDFLLTLQSWQRGLQ